MKNFILLLFSVSLALQSTAQRLIPRDPVGRYGVENEPLPNDRWMHWSSFITSVLYADGSSVPLDDNSVLTDGMLVNAAMEAWNDMNRVLRGPPYGLGPKKIPRAMSILHVPGQLIFSSSVRGPDSFELKFPKSCVNAALGRCAATTGGNHKNGANCGEPSAVHLFCLKNPNKAEDIEQGRGLPQPARVITVGVDEKGENMAIKDPCGPPPGNTDLKKWGCDRFVPGVKIRPILLGTNNEQVPGDWIFKHSRICLVEGPLRKRFNMADINNTAPLIDVKALVMLAS
jgi:hypothetical protein